MKLDNKNSLCAKKLPDVKVRGFFYYFYIDFKLEGLIESPIKGSSRNKEFFGYFIPIALNVIPSLTGDPACPP